MTGLDCLREEMEKRGCNKAQIESKTAAVVLDILSNSGTIYTDIQEAEKRLSDLRNAISVRELNAALREQRINNAESRNKKILEDIEKAKERFLKPETPAARDRLRLAQFYKDSVEINNEYQRTAFIKGLGAILAGQQEEEDDG